MENTIVQAIITATSKKQNGDFKQEIPTKTAYLTADKENSKKLVDFGLTEYTSKDGESYFIIKLVNKLMLYPTGDEPRLARELSLVELDGVETNNFRTPEDRPVGLNILKGENKGNTFYRLQAIQIVNDSDIEEIKPENPFGDLPF